MTRQWRCTVLAMLLGFSSMLQAQEVTFTAETTTGNGSVVPVLTWDTSPLATNCVASGDWSGDKGGAGTETLPAITTSATYNLVCTFSSAAEATLSWTAPTKNTDGTDLTDLAGFKLYWGVTPGGPYNVGNRDIQSATATSHTVTGMAPGTYYFKATAYNTNNVASKFSNEAIKVVSGTSTGSESVGITVNAEPNPPTDLN